MNELKKLGVELTFFIAGVAGAFVSLHDPNKPKNIWKVLFHVSSGGLSSMYITPFVSSTIGMNSSATLFSSFIIGYMGYKAADMGISVISKRIKKQ